MEQSKNYSMNGNQYRTIKRWIKEMVVNIPLVSPLEPPLEHVGFSKETKTIKSKF